MLPDYKKAKTRANLFFLRWVHEQIPALTPLIRGVASFRQHEGRIGKMVRADDSEHAIDYKEAQFKFELTRQEMKSVDTRRIQEKLLQLAKDIGQEQARRMLETAKQAAESAGNVVSGKGDFSQEVFLEVLRRVQMDFDPKTYEPAPGLSWVLSPEAAASLVPRAKEWEEDPEFNAKHHEVIRLKREEWLDREANRKLAD